MKPSTLHNRLKRMKSAKLKVERAWKLLVRAQEQLAKDSSKSYRIAIAIEQLYDAKEFLKQRIASREEIKSNE